MVGVLADAALDAMSNTAKRTDASGTEVFCACFTIALQAIKTAKRMGLDLEPMREAIAKIYAEFPPEVVN